MARERLSKFEGISIEISMKGKHNKNQRNSQVLVAHACNPSYSRD
jgi:hypothetical protein